MNLNKKVADKIREVRLSKPFSAEEVAKMIEKSKSAYSQLENGKTEISMSVLEKLSTALNEPIINFLPISTNSIVINHDSSTGFIGNQIIHNTNDEVLSSLNNAIALLTKSFDILSKKK